MTGSGIGLRVGKLNLLIAVPGSDAGILLEKKVQGVYADLDEGVSLVFLLGMCWCPLAKEMASPGAGSRMGQT